MLNKPLLKTTMELVEIAGPAHDNRWYARRVTRKPASETYCFATWTVLNVYPEAEIIWVDAVHPGSLEPDPGVQVAHTVRLPDGRTDSICGLAAELLGSHDISGLFYHGHTKESLRVSVDGLLAE